MIASNLVYVDKTIVSITNCIIVSQSLMMWYIALEILSCNRCGRPLGILDAGIRAIEDG
jgi:hypothetical protein